MVGDSVSWWHTWPNYDILRRLTLYNKNFWRRATILTCCMQPIFVCFVFSVYYVKHHPVAFVFKGLDSSLSQLPCLTASAILQRYLVILQHFCKRWPTDAEIRASDSTSVDNLRVINILLTYLLTYLLKSVPAWRVLINPLNISFCVIGATTQRTTTSQSPRSSRWASSVRVNIWRHYVYFRSAAVATKHPSTVQIRFQANISAQV